MKSKINREWHSKNKMPKNPTLEQRVKWHLAHQENCTCRPIAGKLAEEIKKLGLSTGLRFRKSQNVNDHDYYTY